MYQVKKLAPSFRLMRRLIQIAAFVLFPGLFISVFSALGQIYKAAIGGTFRLSTLSGPLLLLLAVFPITILWGRFFCGFLCAFGSMGDFFWAISRRIFKKNLRIDERADRLLKHVKYVVLLLIVIFVWTLAVPLDSTLNPWTIFGMYASVTGWPSASFLVSLGAVFLLLIILGSLLIERFFCRYLCPLGAVFTLVSRFRLFRIKKPREKCGSCRLCSRQCSMGIPLYQTDVITSGECIDCFACVEACPRHNVTAKPTPAVAATLSVAAMSGLYYAGSLVPQSTDNTASSPVISDGSGLQGQYEDGVYTGSASGYKGTTTVQVTVENGYIIDITVVSTGDDNEFFSRAKSTVISAILNQQSADVDTVTGATFSSNAIINAVKNALAITGDSGADDASATTPTESSSPAATESGAGETTDSDVSGSFSDGVYTGSGTGFRGETTVSVTVTGGQISEITVESYQDDAAYFNRAKDTVISDIIKAQSADVDAVTGATFSSNGIMEAVADALGLAYENPNSSMESGNHPGGAPGNGKDGPRN